ncbi:MAG: hypothetical protein LAO77_18400 [Acidobacteriia bacterium]|nr:hypothetical protein [Terriglobia bacterium]
MSSRPAAALASIGAAAIGVALAVAQPRAAKLRSFSRGDVVVSFQDGSVQWHRADGSLYTVLKGTVPGNAEGMRFDASGNLYVSHWCVDGNCALGNTIEKFDVHGRSLGSVGSGYDCNPHAIDFDAAGHAYVGQADCTGDILKFTLGQPPTSYTVAQENRGSFWIDLAPDDCTIFYTSWGPDILRYNACTQTQLPRFNVVGLPGGETHGLAVLADGGVLVSSGAVVSRLNVAGIVVQTYSVSFEPEYWAGLDLVGDGTFWAVNYYTSNVHRFNLTTGARTESFSTGAPVYTAVDVKVSP